MMMMMMMTGPLGWGKNQGYPWPIQSVYSSTSQEEVAQVSWFPSCA
jgi:hypothetical protein